ncbi:MAG: hypothetical protein R3E32_14175 [Chitinophagales bacterium]
MHGCRCTIEQQYTPQQVLLSPINGVSFSSTEQNPIVSNADAASTGDYSVTITVDGCVSQGATTSVIVNAVPLATATNDSPTCMGADVQLNSNTSTTGTTVTYQWSTNSFSSTEQNPIVSNADAASTGDYSVTITVDGCVSTTSESSMRNHFCNRQCRSIGNRHQ